MINDWVHSDILNQPYQIGRPSDFRFMYTRAQDVFDENGEFIHIHPIPLTPEILEANGFICDEYERMFEYEQRKYGWFAIRIEGVSPHHDTITIMLRHVHEFQHALRLLGYNCLADNLKLPPTVLSGMSAEPKQVKV